MTGSRLRIGISGWRYRGWRGRFYPAGLPQRLELAFAGTHFNSLEINGTFYALQRPERFRRWHDAVPDDFLFAVKGPRFITHMKKLAGVETPLANFLASGLLRLGTKLGPILWQLPARQRFEPVRLEAFLGLLPRDTAAAAALARRHDARLAGRAWTEAEAMRPLRHALEVRHESFRDAAFVALLRRQGVALVVADGVGWPRLEDVTADFVYVRLHGSEQLYASGYDDDALDRWAGRCRAWAAGRTPSDARLTVAPPRVRRRDVLVYFDNDAKVRAPADALGLARRLGIREPAPRPVISPPVISPG
ncbi:MAG: DUF72 domain-containing protein [Dongiaceae bacterium]